MQEYNAVIKIKEKISAEITLEHLNTLDNNLTCHHIYFNYEDDFFSPLLCQKVSEKNINIVKKITEMNSEMVVGKICSIDHIRVIRANYIYSIIDPDNVFLKKEYRRTLEFLVLLGKKKLPGIYRDKLIKTDYVGNLAVN